MIKRLRPFVGTIFVFAFLLSAFASASVAQNKVKSPARLERERLARVMDKGTDIEEFRQEYLNYVTEMQDNMRLLSAIPDLKQQLNRSGLNSSALLSAAKTSVAEMSQEDLNKFRSVYAKFPGWREMPQALLRPALRQELQAKLDAKKAGEIISKVADDCVAGINAGTTNTDISIARAAEIAAETVIEGMPTDGITIAARLIPVGLHAAARTAVLTLETLKGIKDDCRDDSFQDAITADVDAIPGLISNSTSTTATNISASTATTATNIATSTATTATNITNAKTEILTAVEAAKTYIVTDAHANKDEMKNLLLRTQIEADLASTDGSTFVALYETPSNVCLTSLNDKGLPQTVSLPGFPTITIQQCGLLDLVRAIVRDTIANVGAGTNAQSFFAAAEAHKAAGKYKAAYASYRMAYKAASK